MKTFCNEVVYVDGSVREHLKFAKASYTNERGVFTSLGMWIKGDNLWGWHQDLRFGESWAEVQRSQRIADAVDDEAEAGAKIVLSSEDWEVLYSAAADPRRHAHVVAVPPCVLRAIWPLFVALESADEVAG